jgi:hypothetical protein
MVKGKKNRKAVLVIGLLALAVALFAAVNIRAKYIMTVKLTGAVHFSAELADSMTLLESKAVRQTDGSYKLQEEKVTQNTYVVMPGVDIPKDPAITITDKSNVPSYLYVEVVEKNLPTTIQYALTTDWVKLDGVTGKHNGIVYVYKNTTIDNTSDLSAPIPILKDNRLNVSDAFKPGTTEFQLEFYGYMAQQISQDSAAATFGKAGF